MAAALWRVAQVRHSPEPQVSQADWEGRRLPVARVRRWKDHSPEQQASQGDWEEQNRLAVAQGRRWEDHSPEPQVSQGDWEDHSPEQQASRGDWEEQSRLAVASFRWELGVESRCCKSCWGQRRHPQDQSQTYHP
jgi:hypothetical protein